MKRKFTCRSSAHPVCNYPSIRTPLVLALAAALGVTSLATLAATLSVDSDVDSGTTETCTLRQAIDSVNGAAVVGGCSANGSFGSADTIVFDTSVFPSGNANVITLTGGRINISASELLIDASANGKVTIDANHASAVIRDTAAAGSSLTLKHLSLINGMAGAGDCAGGICIPQADLTLIHSTVSDNSAGIQGGGINASGGSVLLTASSVSGNSSDYGAGIISLHGNITLSNSTINGNSATKSGGGIVVGDGPVALTNSTVSGNSAVVKGGGIYGANLTGIPIIVTLIASTISDNSAGNDGGAIGSLITLFVNADNSIVAGNTGDDIGSLISVSGEYNLIDNVANPGLGLLQDNGGPTWTMLPQPGSAVIDAGTCSGGVPVMDQRGVPRPQGASCDIGAVEVLLAAAGFSDGSVYARYGQPRTWVLTLVNQSNTDLSAVSVQGNAPPQVNAGAMHWYCSASFGASCSAHGTGALSDSNVFIPAHGVVTWAVSAPIKANASGSTVTMSVHSGGVLPAFDVEDTDTLVLFRDGFDVPGGDGTMVVPVLLKE